MRSIGARIVVFFSLACAFTWFGHLGNMIWPSPAWPVPMFPLGPFLAVFPAIWLLDGPDALVDWLKRIARFRAPVWVCVFAFLWPLAVILASVVLAVMTGAATRPLPDYGFDEFLIGIPVVAVMGPVPEELSFRGHAQHQLQQRISAFSAAIWIGLGVVIWHAPLILAGELVWPWTVAIVAVSVVYAWLYRAGGSVWPLALLHFVVNYFGASYFALTMAEPAGQFLFASIHAGFYVALAAFVVWRFGPSLEGAASEVPKPA